MSPKFDLKFWLSLSLGGLLLLIAFGCALGFAAYLFARLWWMS
jgi:hypothetical protein